jgi:hypothetical protein
VAPIASPTIKSTRLIARLAGVFHARSKAPFKVDAKSLVARATAKNSGERVGFERAVGDRMLLCDEIRGEPTQALKPIPIAPRN